jgi:hypothetical protein
MNCKNCGAPLRGGKCEYCGTEYDAPPKRYVNPTIARYLRDLYLGGKVEDPPQLEFTTKYQRIIAEKFLLAAYPPFPETE